MDTGTRTRSRHPGSIRPDNNPVFRKFSSQYYGYALQWCNYDRWTIEEAANLLTGCVPHREMFLKGEKHALLDQEVLETENKIRTALGGDLKVIESKKYFAKTYIKSANIMDWAKKQDIAIPKDLLEAWNETRHRITEVGYSTPCLEAAEWVVQNYWINADLREPPTPGEIIRALLQRFPDVTGEECEMVERITRHPVARHDEADWEPPGSIT